MAGPRSYANVAAGLPPPPPTPVVTFPDFNTITRNITYPAIPPEWRVLDPFVLGDPITPPLSLPQPGPANSNGGRSTRSATRSTFRFDFDNTEGVCFRNAALQCLLHVPVLYNFLMGHYEDEHTPRWDPCLICMLRDVALHYYPAVSTDRTRLYEKLNTLYLQCQQDFWGPTSRLRSERPNILVGPDDGKGGNLSQFATWLISYLIKQTHQVPRDGIDECHFLKRMFWTTFVATKTCASNHRQTVWRKRLHFMNMNTRRPAPESVSVEDGLATWLRNITNGAGNATTCSTRGCRSRCSRKVQIDRAPEILLVRAPIRNSNSASDSDYYFRIPFAQTIDLSAHSATGESLIYSLKSMSLLTGAANARHVVAIVQAADGLTYNINNGLVEQLQLPTWHVNHFQSDNFAKDDRFLPVFFVYLKEAGQAAQPAAGP